VGYRGKIEERERARELRARSWTLVEIADELGVAKSSVSVWTRDVDFVPRPRNRGHASHKPHPLTLNKRAELERCRDEAVRFADSLTNRDLQLFGYALYVGEGAKTEASGLRLAKPPRRTGRSYCRFLENGFTRHTARFNDPPSKRRSTNWGASAWATPTFPSFGV
jgi:transcriptional regulator with XRE-family HTH domain